MLASDVISDVRLELMETSAAFWSDTELLTYLNRGELDFANRVRGLESVATVSTVAGQAEYPLPSNWLSCVAVFYNDRQNDTDSWRRLDVTDLQELSMQNPNFLSRDTTSRGTPDRVYFWNRSMYLETTPLDNGDANIKMFYKAKPVPITSVSQSINLDDSLSHALRHYILWKAWRKEKEFQLAADEQAMYFQSVKDGLRHLKLQALNKTHNLDVQSASPFTLGE